jgi:hypothetical protein
MRTDLEDNRKRTESNDEIDISVLFDKIGLFFGRISNAFVSFKLLVKRNFLFITLLTVLGTALSFGAYKLTKPFYTSSITLIVPNIRNEFIEDQLVKLSDMIDDNNHEALSARLHISADHAQQMKEMHFSNLDQDKIDGDSILTGSPFRVRLTLYDRQLFDTMEYALTGFLQNNRYFAKHRDIKKRKLQNVVTKLRSDISSIDSMRANISEPKGPVNGFIYGQPIDPTNLYREGVAMYREQVEKEAELQQLESVEVVTSFVPRLRPTGPNLILYLILGGLSSFLLASALASSMEARKRHRQV